MFGKFSKSEGSWPSGDSGCFGVAGTTPIMLTDDAKKAIMLGDAPFLEECVEETKDTVTWSWKYNGLKFNASKGTLEFLYNGKAVACLEFPFNYSVYDDITITCMEGMSKITLS